MSHPQFQFVDFDSKRRAYTCQFADSEDPRETARFASTSLDALHCIACNFLRWKFDTTGDSFTARTLDTQLDRIRTLFNKISEEIARIEEQRR